jgi:hypothetical protein
LIQLQSDINTELPITKRNDAITNYATIQDDLRNVDAIGEGTTLKLFDEIELKDEEDIHAKSTTHKMTKPTVTTTSKRTTTSKKTTTPKRTTTPHKITTMSTKVMSDSSTLHDVLTTKIDTTTNGFDDPSNTSNLNSSTPTNISYPYYNDGYYFQGYPQNISHVEFTSQATTTNSFVPVRYHNFNEILQQYPTNYYDSSETQSHESFNHYNQFKQSPPKVNNYYSRNIEFLPNRGNNFLLNGFKPSFPFHL